MNKKSRSPFVLIYILVPLLILFFLGNILFSKNKEKIMDYSDFLAYVKEHKVEAIAYNEAERKLYGLVIDSERAALQKKQYSSLFANGNEPTQTPLSKSLSESLFSVFGARAPKPLTVKDLPDEFDFLVVTDPERLHNDLRAIVAQNDKVEASSVDSTQYGFEFKNIDPTGIDWLNIISTVLMLGAVGFIFFTLIRQQSGGGAGNRFGKSKVRVVQTNLSKVTFADVAGADEEKQELQEFVEFLREPKRFTNLGARIPKGLLLTGPPGTGKTLLAKAAAGEAGVPFYAISGSDFVEMYVGVGAGRVRDLFATAKRTAPAIIFIDEIDAVGRKRGAGLGGGHDEREQTLNQLLVEMDGFDENLGVIVIAATNRSDILDPALLRPGRFDRQVVVNRPDVKGREQILQIHSKNKPLDETADLKSLAQGTPGFTGADLEQVLNEAAILAVRANKAKIGQIELSEAILKTIAGPEKRSSVVRVEDKKITAIHEAGHAVIAHSLPGCDRVHEISIIPRGMAAGMTVSFPLDERSHMMRAKLLDDIVMMLGGRVAEQIFVGDISTGAYNDLQRATEITRRMIMEFGMSEKIGPVFLGGEHEVFLGKDLGSAKLYSDDLANVIDTEVHDMLTNAYSRAEQILSNKKDLINAVVERLMKDEHISGDEFETICKQFEAKPETNDSSIDESKN